MERIGEDFSARTFDGGATSLRTPRSLLQGIVRVSQHGFVAIRDFFGLTMEGLEAVTICRGMHAGRMNEALDDPDAICFGRHRIF